VPTADLEISQQKSQDVERNMNEVEPATDKNTDVKKYRESDVAGTEMLTIGVSPEPMSPQQIGRD